MYNALYNHNIHSQIIKLFYIKKTIYSLSSTNEFAIHNISRYLYKFCIGYKGHLIWKSLSINININHYL